MTIVVAHQANATGRLALREGVRQAGFRGTDVVVVHVTENVDLDLTAAHRAGLEDEIAAAVAEVGSGELSWTLQLASADDKGSTAESILDLTAGADLLVIGARRRSPVGKLFLGSVTQQLILRADVPVLVVKS